MHYIYTPQMMHITQNVIISPLQKRPDFIVIMKAIRSKDVTILDPTALTAKGAEPSPQEEQVWRGGGRGI